MSNLLKYGNVNVESSRVIYNSSDSDENCSSKKAKQNFADSDRAREEAKKIIDEANTCVENAKSNAKEEAKLIFKEAKAAGYEEGLEVATDEVESKNQATLNEIKHILKKLDDQKSNLITDNKQNIIALAFKIAEKVINKKIDVGDDIILKIYERAVKDIVAQKWLKVSVSQYDVQVVTSNSEYLLSMVGGAERLEVEVLENAPKGTCIVETTEKIVDASINTQLEALYNAIVSS